MGLAIEYGERGPEVLWHDDGWTAALRLAKTSDDRFVVVEVAVRTEPGGHVITSQILRRVPVARMLSFANGSGRPLLRQLFGLPPDAPASSGTDLAGDANTAAHATGTLAVRSQVATTAAPPKRRPRMKLPTYPANARKPDSFYQRIAQLYRWLVETEEESRPAAVIANANDVPLTSVHRWIRESRRRGFLGGPGVPGRAGATETLQRDSESGEQ